MYNQIVDVGLTSRILEDYLVKSNYWDTPEKRLRHAYITSPCAYVLLPSQKTRLEIIARVVFRSVICLEHKLAELARASTLTHTEAQFIRMARGASRGLIQPGEGSDRQIPPVIKLDMVQDTAGNYFVVEVDVYNPRALGLMALCDNSLPLVGHKPAYPIVSSLQSELHITQEPGFTELTIVVSEFERYYETSFLVLAKALSASGIRTRLMREREVVANPKLLGKKGLWVFAIPEGLDRNPSVRDLLVARYRAGSVHAFYPPKAYLGSKSLLPFLASQEEMSGIVPATEHVMGKYEPRVLSESHTLDQMVLKFANSSGSKRVVFSHLDPEKFWTILKESKNTRTPQWIIQKQVPQTPIPVVVFTSEKERGAIPCYLRITAYVTKSGVGGIRVTGRSAQLVHGAFDSIQLPVVQSQ